MEILDLAASQEPRDLAEVNAAGNLVEGMGAYRAATAPVPCHLTKIRCPDIPIFFFFPQGSVPLFRNCNNAYLILFNPVNQDFTRDIYLPLPVSKQG